jgi:hypothetical protein
VARGIIVVNQNMAGGIIAVNHNITGMLIKGIDLAFGKALCANHTVIGAAAPSKKNQLVIHSKFAKNIFAWKNT